jgi:pimeloyl-ACP methyl ester carboxylesterase
MKFQNNQEMTAFAKSFSKASPETIYGSSRDLYRVSKEDMLLMRLVQLSIPVFGIYGAKNKGRFSSEKKLLSKFPVRFIPDAGHAMMYDNPDFFYKTVIEYVNHLSY